MGAYCSKPVTEKVSESGEFRIVNRRILYGASAMQGWRISMEDAHSVVPCFDEKSSLFGVYDGHGGREVATYCATHLPDIIKATEAYGQGDLGQAMKDAFMKCDVLITEKSAIEEMKHYDEDVISEEEQEPELKEDLDSLLEESSMPLKDLLAKYNAPVELDASNNQSRDSTLKKEVNLILQLLTSPEAGEDTDSDSEEEICSSDEIDSSDDDGSEDAGDDKTESVEDKRKTTLSSATQENTQVDSVKQSPSKKHHSDAVENSHIRSLQSLVHDSIQTNSHSESLTIHEARTHEGAGNVPQNFVKTKSLMDLLTSKPSEHSAEEKLFSPSTRKRLRQSEEGNGDYSSSPKRAVKRDKQGYHSGTTAVVGILRENEFIVANAGDSKCVLSQRGKAIDMSFDHKPTDKVELDRILNAGGHVGPDSRVNGGLNLSRAIGDHFYKENSSLPLEAQMISAMPDIQSAPINDDQEFIVLACDGICSLLETLCVAARSDWSGPVESGNFRTNFFGLHRNSLSSQEVVDFVSCKLKEKVGNKVPTQEDLSLICESVTKGQSKLTITNNNSS